MYFQREIKLSLKSINKQSNVQNSLLICIIYNFATATWNSMSKDVLLWITPVVTSYIILIPILFWCYYLKIIVASQLVILYQATHVQWWQCLWFCLNGVYSQTLNVFPLCVKAKCIKHIYQLWPVWFHHHHLLSEVILCQVPAELSHQVQKE